MPAVDLRRMIGVAVASEGGGASGDFAVSQRAAGANMSVDVAAGDAYIADDHAGGGGVYHAVWPALENVVIAANASGNPRVDRVVLRVRDLALGDAANAIDLFVVAGTPTAGATLVNLNGVTAVPGSCLLLANVLVANGAASILNADIDSSASVRQQLGLAGAATVYVAASTLDVVSSTTETALLSQLIPAGLLGTTRGLRVVLRGDLLNNTGGNQNLTIRIKFGGTTLYASVVASVASALRQPLFVDFELRNIGAANSQFLEGAHASLGTPSAPTTGIQNANAPHRFGTTGLPAINTAVAQTLEVTVQHGASSASLSARRHFWVAEVI